jgi:hypothetical protein
MDEDEEAEVRDYEKLVENEARDRGFQKLEEVPIVEKLSEMNLNQATRGNAGGLRWEKDSGRVGPDG